MLSNGFNAVFSGTPLCDGYGYLFVPRDMISEYELADEWADMDTSHILALEDYTTDDSPYGSLDREKLNTLPVSKN